MRYLWKHKHWTPFAHTCITVRCKAPIFLARQLVKHQVGLVWNEESRRYIDTKPEYYIPESLHIAPTNAKQGAGTAFTEVEYKAKIDRLIQNTDECDDMYLNSIRGGMAPEEARMFLPLNTHTNWVWSGSLVAFMRVIEQRSDSHAQGAAQEFAKLLRAAISDTYPMAIAAYNEVHNGRD
jgi:thymidylate synthase (FAD)